MNILTSWHDPAIPELVDAPEALVRTSTSYFDNIVDPTTTPNDRKNMRIKGESIANSNSGGGDKGCTIRIDPDETNKLQNRERGLYVPPTTWEKLS